jgi:hypothetical protein
MQRGEEEIVELVNTVVDREATPAEEAELRRAISASDHARELFESTREIAQRLEALPREDFPAVVKQEVVEQIVWRRASARRGRTEARPFARRRLFAFAWAAAAALALFVVMIGRPHLTDTGATMARPHATLKVERNGDIYTLEPVFSGPFPSTISMSWDEEKLVFIGISDEKDASFGKAQVKFTLRDPSERVRVMVRPRGGSKAAEIRVWAGEEEVMRTVVPFG